MKLNSNKHVEVDAFKIKDKASTPSPPKSSHQFHKLSVNHYMKMVKLICQNCNKEFERYEGEYKRCQLKGYSFTACDRSCFAILRNKKFAKGNIANFGEKFKKRDEFSPFRYYLGKARVRDRVKMYGQYDITLEYLKNLWDTQKGICPYTGIKMYLPPAKWINEMAHFNPQKASLDRIDSSKGYLKGNVEFVCIFINLGKTNLQKITVQNFLNEIKTSIPNLEADFQI